MTVISLFALLFIIVLPVPIVMVVFGAKFQDNAPDYDAYFVHRTKRSSQNCETWEFAHQLLGRLWTTSGWGMLFIILFSVVFFPLMSISFLAKYMMILFMLEVVAAIICFIIVECRLRSQFDEYGWRKDDE